ncbi:MAG: RloB domain-containing protein [Nanoarchaeota archaeon]|nr:RloB domain-containing protein [Nanoarchaeota archaeon]
MARKSNKRLKRTLYIFCEGETERNYFEGLKKDSSNDFSIKIIISPDKKPKDIITYSLNSLQRKSYDKNTDLVFCVFDSDNNTKNDLDTGLKLAKEKEIEVIFSNPSFEYWFLCHFGKFTQSYDNKGLISKLSQYISNYQKNDIYIYEKTKDKLKIGIKNSKEVEAIHVKNKVELVSKDSNPVTLVYRIIEKLSK